MSIFAPMKWVLIIVGIVFDLVGAVWMLQGTSVLTRSVMSGDTKWTVIGAILVVVGIVFIVRGATRKKAKRA
jgi:multisubunit Na+/H+ antiporter MnhG subunit